MAWARKTMRKVLVASCPLLVFGLRCFLMKSDPQLYLSLKYFGSKMKDVIGLVGGVPMSGCRYSELIVWQKSMELAVSVYHHTENFPKEEHYGLRSQVRRACISIPSNIAEGQARGSKKSFLLYLSICCGSLCELETQIVLASKLGYLTEQQQIHLMNQCSEIGRLLNGLTKSLKKSQPATDN
jgi:four helix bundle protein